MINMASLTDVLGENTRRTIEWLILRTMAPFGAATPAEQTATSMVLAMVAWSSSFVTLGLSIIIAVVFTFTFFWGLFRIFTEGATAGGWSGSVQNSGGTI